MKVILFILLVWVSLLGEARNVTHVTLTCYQPTKAQCDADPTTTSDGSKINLHHLKKGRIKWCAVSRDLLWMFPKNRPRRIYIEGYGVYEVRDTMNVRHNHRVDILVHPSNKKLFKKDKVKIVIL